MLKFYRAAMSRRGNQSHNESGEDVPLVSSPDDSDHLEFDESGQFSPHHTYENGTSHNRDRSLTHRIVLVSSTIVCLLSACLSVFLTFHRSLNYPATDNLSLYELQSKELSHRLYGLSRPSQFMGLEKINRTSDHLISVINYPFLVARIDEAHPHSPLLTGVESRKIVEGLEVRRVQIDRDISTVIQFRAIDWKLEKCTLHLNLPNEDWGSIDIFRLGADTVLDSSRLSYATRPSVNEKLGNVDISITANWSQPFHCLTDSIHTFLLVAAQPDTRVSWWQDKTIEHASVYITQQGF
ncbi:hypothetical protein E1B28_000720 [Marasmius oreades]|uniref:Ubiquitin 3 binding protein But2 C-terminal domain-containing protein n=1 Tax=Marasmius oreades TaxID=181124 RepID=A0A9P7V1W6_9AGAR|nr:uncharacterized protein E1B28_000720 [Marasmius oreades]KAG7098815.1 hypothetical protein E1B28_000720 [Marasmius oreades]